MDNVRSLSNKLAELTLQWRKYMANPSYSGHEHWMFSKPGRSGNKEKLQNLHRELKRRISDGKKLQEEDGESVGAEHG